MKIIVGQSRGWFREVMLAQRLRSSLCTSEVERPSNAKRDHGEGVIYKPWGRGEGTWAGLRRSCPSQAGKQTHARTASCLCQFLAPHRDGTTIVYVSGIPATVVSCQVLVRTSGLVIEV